MLRFLVATLTVVPGRWRLDGVPRLRERPVGPLVEALCAGSARSIEYLAAEGYVPLRIEGGTLRGGTTTLDAGESSQYLSALLMAALRAPSEVVVEVPTLTSRPYVDVTIAAAVGLRRPHRAGGAARLPRPPVGAARRARPGRRGLLGGLLPGRRRGADRRRGDPRRPVPRLQAGGPRVHGPPRRDGGRDLLEGGRSPHPRRRRRCGGSRPTSPACPTRCPPSPPSPPSPRGRR